MKRTIGLLGVLALSLAVYACHPGRGERCNPLLFSDECHADNSNVFCTVPPNCAVAYCCQQDGDGGIFDTNANCQACSGPDMAMPAPADLGMPDLATSTD